MAEESKIGALALPTPDAGIAPEAAETPEAPAAPLVGDINKESFKSRRNREGKVFSDGFKIPGFSSYSDLPGKICVDCGFAALKFSQQCPKCGGKLVAEPTS